MKAARALWVVWLASGCGGSADLPAVGPEQPIPFSHAMHAGDLRIDCRHCHTRVARASQANYPAVTKCQGCHAGVTEDHTTPAMRAVTRHFEERRPIEWTQVNVLPDHVRFHHGAHVQALVSCETCHGPVRTMTRVRRTEVFTMPFCTNCHRREGASVECLTCHQ